MRHKTIITRKRREKGLEQVAIYNHNIVKDRGTVIVEEESKRYAKERQRERDRETLWRACKESVCMYIYILYIYILRERERERERVQGDRRYMRV